MRGVGWGLPRKSMNGPQGFSSPFNGVSAYELHPAGCLGLAKAWSDVCASR